MLILAINIMEITIDRLGLAVSLWCPRLFFDYRLALIGEGVTYEYSRPGATNQIGLINILG